MTRMVRCANRNRNIRIVSIRYRVNQTHYLEK